MTVDCHAAGYVFAGGTDFQAKNFYTDRMTLHETSSRRHKFTSWIIIAAMFMAMQLPAHYHFYHNASDNPDWHTHTINLHLLADDSDQSHRDQGSSRFSASPDKDVKNISILAPFIILTILLVLTPNRVIRFARIQHYHDGKTLKYYLHFTPPLRAPPLL